MIPHPRMLALLLAAAALVAGCGDEEATPSQAAPEQAAQKSKPLPAVGDNPLLPGTRYVAEQFDPGLSIELPDGPWRTGLPASRELVEIQLLASPPTMLSVIAFQRIEQVFDPRKGGRTAADAVKAPDDFGAWLSSHPRLKASAPVDVELAGAKGVQIDVTPRSYPSRMPKECEESPAPCVPLMVHDGEPIVYPQDMKARFYVLDVGGEQIVAEAGVAPADQFAVHAPLLEEALRGARFEP